MKINLSAPFGSATRVDEFDVLQLKKALNRLGYYQPFEKVGITDMAETALFVALRNFQADSGLSKTGEARPADATIEAINRALAKPFEGSYMWRSVEDDKVRGSHARYNRTLRAWNEAPDPGEDFNCRCWAEHVDTDTVIYPDAIESAIGPFDILLGGWLKGTSGAVLKLLIKQALKIFNDRKSRIKNEKFTEHGSLRLLRER